MVADPLSTLHALYALLLHFGTYQFISDRSFGGQPLVKQVSLLENPKIQDIKKSQKSKKFQKIGDDLQEIPKNLKINKKSKKHKKTSKCFEKSKNLNKCKKI